MAKRGNFDPDKTGFFQTQFFLAFEKWDPDIFQKSEISKISSSSHSKNDHLKLNGFQWVFGGWGDAPFIFLWAGWAKSPKMDPFRAVYPPGLGNRYLHFCKFPGQWLLVKVRKP